MPIAIEQIDLTAYDLIISSNHAVAKGVLAGPNQLHISYVHTPMRYAWDLQHRYLAESPLGRGLSGVILRCALHRLRIWDARTANGVDTFVANSKYIARRIQKAYRRDADVIYPPVHVAGFPFKDRKDDYYVTASRMVPYKRMELIVEAFAAMPNRRLVVIGDGPEFKRIKSKVTSNIQLLGEQSHDALVSYMQSARAFVFAGEEDFGIVLAEAQATGTPVIAFRKGGAAEIVRDIDLERPTGLLYSEQTIPGIVEAVRAFEAAGSLINPANCRENALRFGDERFRSEFTALVSARWRAFVAGQYGA